MDGREPVLVEQNATENTMGHQLPNEPTIPKNSPTTPLVPEAKDEEKPRTLLEKCKSAVVPGLVGITVISLIIMLFVINNAYRTQKQLLASVPMSCNHSSCSISLVESIPENLTYPSGSPSHPSTYSCWKSLLEQANSTIQISSMYWTLLEKDIDNGTPPSANQGADVYRLLVVALARGVQVYIAVDSGFSANNETLLLQQHGAKLVKMNFSALVGGGVLHTKFIIVDSLSFYIGSANMDWRSLTQVKEMGTCVSRCPCVTSDIEKIFNLYWLIGKSGVVHKPFPPQLDTHYNATNPLQLGFSNQSADVFMSVSPPDFLTPSRDGDIETITNIMNTAQRYIYVAVMDYFPTTLYCRDCNIFWPVIDDTFKKLAFEKDIQVRLLTSKWNHTKPAMLGYLKSLSAFSTNIQVKVFIVPADAAQSRIPFARVNHNKYMVTDQVAYIGTSNWSGDYFINTAGVGLIFNQSASSTTKHTPPTSGTQPIRAQLEQVFLRDWNSQYSHSLDDI